MEGEWRLLDHRDWLRSANVLIPKLDTSLVAGCRRTGAAWNESRNRVNARKGKPGNDQALESHPLVSIAWFCQSIIRTGVDVAMKYGYACES